MARVWDVVVVGGGPAGCMTALTLHTLGHSVVVVDEKALGSDGLPPFRPSQYSGETISPSAMEILERLGVTLDYDGSPHLEWQGTRSIWSSADAVDQDFIFNKRGQRGWILHRTVFDQDLRKRVSETGIEIIASSSVRSASKPDEGLWALEVLQAPSPGEGDKEHEGHRLALSASWVVDATGRRASIARLMGFAPHKLDDLTAFVVHFEECGPSHNSRTCQHDRRVMIEASELGWWYSAHLPLVGGRCQRVVIFHTDSDHAAARQARQAAGFRELLQTSGQTIYQVAFPASVSAVILTCVRCSREAGSTQTSGAPRAFLPRRSCAGRLCAVTSVSSRSATRPWPSTRSPPRAYSRPSPGVLAPPTASRGS
mmetsp:Transcript_31345/g.67655  ORF Transcript_31345/g.67655 Transcript_31345/m.67655 type:complete len:370 (+) Transcript_31345:27-1136(+)